MTSAVRRPKASAERADAKAARLAATGRIDELMRENTFLGQSVVALKQAVELEHQQKAQVDEQSNAKTIQIDQLHQQITRLQEDLATAHMELQTRTDVARSAQLELAEANEISRQTRFEKSQLLEHAWASLQQVECP